MTLLNNPLTRAEFMDELCLVQQRFDLGENVNSVRTRGGQIISAGMGAQLWNGTLQLPRRKHADLRRLEAIASALRKPGQAFMVYDKFGRHPQNDPTGAQTDAASVTIDTLDPDGRRLRLGGLPAAFELLPGDYLAWTYGSSPARRALHRLVTASPAAGDGRTPLMEVEPAIQPGASTGTAVSLTRALCKAVVVPGTFRAVGRARFFSDGFSFDWIQTLR